MLNQNEINVNIIPENLSSVIPISNPKKENQEEIHGHISPKIASLNVANSILGAGILSLPISIRFLGIIFGLISFSLISYSSLLTVSWLIQCYQVTKKKSYAEISKEILGYKGYLLVLIMVILNNFGLCCAYFRIFGETMKNILSAFLDKNNFLITDEYNYHNYLFILFIFFLMGFVIFSDTLEGMESVSFIGVFGILIFAITLLIVYIYKLIYNLTLPKFTLNMLFFQNEFIELLTSLPTIILAFAFQINVFAIYFTLKNQNTKSMIITSLIGIVFSFFIYSIAGIVGYLMYGNDLNDTILNMMFHDIVNYKEQHSFLKWILIISNIGFLMCSTTGIPLMFFELKKNTFQFILILYKLTGRTHKIKKIEKNSKKKKFELNNISDNKEPIITNKIEKTIENNIDSSDLNIETPELKFSKEINSEEEEKYIEEVEMQNSTKFVIIIIIYCIIGIITVIIPGLKILFSLVGCTAANAISFIFPGLMFYILIKQDKIHESKFLPLFITFVGAFFFVFCLICELYVLVIK